jgi:mannose-6-phosphate isomerase-like protein (cupin superfamily)
MIEIYKIKESGYHPFMIREGWQVAQLNFVEEQRTDNINKVEVHNHTDEVFILLKGKAILILAEFKEKKPVFQVLLMEPLVTYNIPKGDWHNIAMEKGSEVLIVEKSGTHLNDVSYKELNPDEIAELRKKLTKY